MNNISLIGNLVATPELKGTSGGLEYCSFSIAVRREFAKNDDVDFIPVKVWGKIANACCSNLKKGSKVAIIGTLRQERYADKDGNSKSFFNVVASNVEFLFSKANYDSEQVEDNGESQQPNPSNKPQWRIPTHSPQISFEQVDDGELPF